jgi:hypothetical protein
MMMSFRQQLIDRGANKLLYGKSFHTGKDAELLVVELGALSTPPILLDLFYGLGQFGIGMISNGCIEIALIFSH